MTFPVAQYFQPLRPLDRPSDEHRYLDIDSSTQMFTRFTETFGDPAEWTSGGHLIVATGDRGYGKTSLIQRCAYWLRSFQQQTCQIVVLDLSAESWPEETGHYWPKGGHDGPVLDGPNPRIIRTFGRIIDKLRASLPVELISELEKNSTDSSNFFYYLGQSLKGDWPGGGASPIVLVVLLASYSTADEVDLYYKQACPGTFFFAEIYDLGETRKVKDQIPGLNQGRNDIQYLTMSVLKSGDGRELADWIRRERPGRPELPGEVVRDRFEHLITERRISISELNKLAWGVLRWAAKDAADRVENIHFNMYYEEMLYRDSA